MGLLTRFQALEAVTALEIYQRDHRVYPERLVPNYLPHLPKNVIHPNVWERKPTLQHEKTTSAYRLLSQSPLYVSIRLKQQQSYGPDGDCQLDRIK